MRYDDTYDNMKQNARGMNSILMGFLIGGLIGIAAALLMAPQSGEETRTLIRDKSSELKDRASSAIDETRSRAEDAVRNVGQRTSEMADRIQERASDVVNRGKSEIEDARGSMKM